MSDSVSRRMVWTVSRWTTCLTSCSRVEVIKCYQHDIIKLFFSCIGDILPPLFSFRNPWLQGPPRPFTRPTPFWPAIPIFTPVPTSSLPSHPKGTPYFPPALCGRSLLRQWTPGRLPGEHYRYPTAGRGARRRPDADRRPSQPNAEHAQHPGPPSLPHGHVRPGFLRTLYRAGLWRPHLGQHGLAGYFHGGEYRWRESGHRSGKRRRWGGRRWRDESGPTGATHTAKCLLDWFSGQYRPAAALGVVSVAQHTHWSALAHTVYRLCLYFMHMSLLMQGSLAHAHGHAHTHAHTNTHSHNLPCLSLAVTVCRMRWNKRETKIKVI